MSSILSLVCEMGNATHLLTQNDRWLVECINISSEMYLLGHSLEDCLTIAFNETTSSEDEQDFFDEAVRGPLTTYLEVLPKIVDNPHLTHIIEKANRIIEESYEYSCEVRTELEMLDDNTFLLTMGLVLDN